MKSCLICSWILEIDYQSCACGIPKKSPCTFIFQSSGIVCTITIHFSIPWISSICPGSGVVLDCIHSWYLPSFLLLCKKHTTCMHIFRTKNSGRIQIYVPDQDWQDILLIWLLHQFTWDIKPSFPWKYFFSKFDVSCSLNKQLSIFFLKKGVHFFV